MLGLVALAYATAVLPEGLANPVREWAAEHPGFPLARLGAAGAAQIPLLVLLAWLADRAPRRGPRRRGWLVITACALASFWLLFDPSASSGVSSISGLSAYILLKNLLFVLAGGLAVDAGLGGAGTGAASAARKVGESAALLAAVFVHPFFESAAPT